MNILYEILPLLPPPARISYTLKENTAPSSGMLIPIGYAVSH